MEPDVQLYMLLVAAASTFVAALRVAEDQLLRARRDMARSPVAAAWRELGERSGVPVYVVPAWPDAPPTLVFLAAPQARVRVTRRGPLERAGDVGDAGFDERARVTGPELEVRALLDASTRAALLRLVEAGGEVGDGRVAIGWPSGEPLGLTHPRVELLIEVLRRLEAKGDPLQRLEQTAVEDPRHGVQVACLQLLLRSARPRGLAAAERLAVAGRGAARHAALRVLGRADLWLLLARDPHEPVTARAEALLQLMGLPPEQVDAALAEALRGPEALQAAVFAALAGPPGERWRATLASMAHATWVERHPRCEAWRSPQLGGALARAFGAWARPDDDEVLLTLGFVDGEVGAAAAEALARVGTARVLSRLPERGPLGEARAAILGRHTGPGAGAVSLAGVGEGGRLSLPDPRAGGLEASERVADRRPEG
jgi:hypothetical protein